MKLHKIAFCLLAAMAALTACSNDDEETLPDIKPQETGTFTDERDGNVYHWVRYGNLEWSVENCRYALNDKSKSLYYIDNEHYQKDETDIYSQKYGFLYTQEGAAEAVPKGWRVPTDEDWKQLEMALGMSKSDADAREWRGTNQATLMQQSGEGTMLGLQLAGYYTTHTIMATSGWRFMATYGYYWTSTKDTDKDGEYYFVRKLFYKKGQVWRESMESKAYMLYLRFVRDAE